MKTLKLYRGITVLLFLSTLLVSMKCDETIKYEVTFINKSDEPVSIDWGLHCYFEHRIPNAFALQRVDVGDCFTIQFIDYERFVDNLNILVYKQSTLDAHTEEERIEEGIFDKRFVLSYKELEKANFVVIYE